MQGAWVQGFCDLLYLAFISMCCMRSSVWCSLQATSDSRQPASLETVASSQTSYIWTPQRAYTLILSQASKTCIMGLGFCNETRRAPVIFALQYQLFSSAVTSVYVATTSPWPPSVYSSCAVHLLLSNAKRCHHPSVGEESD